MHKPDIDDGYWLVFADTTQDDRNDKHKKPSEKNWNIRKFRSFLFPAKHYDQTIITANELVWALKPQATVIPFTNKNISPLVYDRAFFNDIECGDAFIAIWDSIVKQNPAYADKILIKLLRAISQTSLKIEYLSKSELVNQSLEDFFDIMRNHENHEKNYYKKFIKKLQELEVHQPWKDIGMDTVYRKLLKNFPELEWCVENICYHTFLRIHNNIDFWLMWVIPKHQQN